MVLTWLEDAGSSRVATVAFGLSGELRSDVTGMTEPQPVHLHAQSVQMISPDHSWVQRRTSPGGNHTAIHSTNGAANAGSSLFFHYGRSRLNRTGHTERPVQTKRPPEVPV